MARSHAYNETFVRTASVLANVVIMLSVFAADPFLCPDGCTDTQHQQSSAPAPEDATAGGGCILCQGGLTPPVNAPSLVPSDAVLSLAEDFESPELFQPVRSLDHPPRFA